jgi:hypothetical protein
MGRVSSRKQRQGFSNERSPYEEEGATIPPLLATTSITKRRKGVLTNNKVHLPTPSEIQIHCRRRWEKKENNAEEKISSPHPTHESNYLHIVNCFNFN